MIRAVLFFLMVLVCGCGDGNAPNPPPIPGPGPVPPPTAPPPVSTGYEVIEVKDGATLHVDVVYQGRVPRQKMPNDQHCSALGSDALDDLVVNAEKQLKDAVVYLEIAKGKDFPTSPAPIFDQKGCFYKPHVALCQPGQRVVFRSSDPILHNVHILALRNKEVNAGVQQGGEFEYMPKYPEFIQVKCDVHPWMNCHLVVQEHPYYAITNERGAAMLSGIPSGNYTVRVWHPKIESQAAHFEAKSGESVSVFFNIIPKAN